MKKLTIILIPCLLLLCAGLGAELIYVVNSESRTLSRIDSESGAVNNVFAQLGLTPNLMELDSDYIYVVCSGDNAVQMLSRQSGAHIRYIPVEGSSNPWDLLKAGDFLYVSGLFTNKVYKISLDSYSVVASLEVGTAPEGLCAAEGKLFVAVTGGYQNGYANSAVAVIDLDSFSLETTIPVWYNPQCLLAADGYLHVSCTGNWAGQSGKIDIIDLETLTRVQRIDIGGNPYALWKQSSGTVFVGEAMGNATYSYDALSWQLLHGSQDPLSPGAYDIDGNNALIALLQPNWGGNSTLQTMNPDWTPAQLYTVGMTSTAVMVEPANTPVDDENIPQVQVKAFPNPVSGDGMLTFSPGFKGDSPFELYDLRGRRLWSAMVRKGCEEVTLPGLKPGVYLYRLGGVKDSFQGKIVVM